MATNLTGQLKVQTDVQSRTVLESRALNDTRNDLLTLFSKYGIDLNPQQQDLLGTISAANRNFFGQTIMGYIKKPLQPSEIADLADAYFAQYHKRRMQTAEDKTAFTSMMTRYGVSDFQGFITPVEANRKQNQELFDKTVKEYFPSAEKVPEYWRCQGFYTLELGIKTPGDPVKFTKRQERYDYLVNGKTYIRKATLAGVIDDEEGFQKTFLQRTVYGLPPQQRKEWLDVALEAGFTRAVVEMVRSAYQFVPQGAGAATQMGRTSMQTIVERIRSVDDLAKQKLEDMRNEDAEGKKLSADEKRKKLREDAEKMLKEEEEGKKTSKKAPEPADLEQATSIRKDMRQEVRLIQSARESLMAKMPLEKAFNDPQFEGMFENHRIEEVKDTRKYFTSGMVPMKVLDAIANIRPPDVASYGPISQLALLRAYRKTLEEYGQKAPRAA